MLLKYADIPSWLQGSDFYDSLSKDEPDSIIEIPTECFREASYPVQTTEDLAAVLKVTGFWGVTQIPQSVLSFCYQNHVSIWNPVFVDIGGEGLPEHTAVVEALKDPTVFTLAMALSLSRPEFVTFWLDNNTVSCEDNKYAIAQACEYGRLDLVRTLQERGFNWDYHSYCAAALHGHIHILQYLHENGCIGCGIAMNFAARGGQLPCMQYLRSLDYRWYDDLTLQISVAARCEDLEVHENVVYFLPWPETCPTTPPPDECLNCLRYALENGCPIHSRACEKAAACGLVDRLRLLRQFNARWDVEAAVAAASAGHGQCLQYLRDQHCPMNYRCTEAAAANGHYVCLVYLHQFIPPLGAGATAAAAGGGHLHCLQFLHENRYAWNKVATSSAARYGHLHCLQYLRQHGCVWEENTCRNACLGGHLSCLQYLHENGCPWDCHVTASAAAKGYLDCLQYLHTKGCPWDHMAALWAAENGHIKCLRFLLENGAPYDDVKLLIAAAGANSLGCLKYLIEERQLTVPSDGVVFGEALITARFQNVQYLVDNDHQFKSYVFVPPPQRLLVKIYDANLRQCIQYAAEHGWQYNSELYDFVKGRNASVYLPQNFLTLCQAYLDNRK